MSQFPWVILFLLVFTSCVKEEGKVLPGKQQGTTNGGSAGGVIPQSPDPLASQAWHLENTGQDSFSYGHGLAGQDISLKAAIAQGYTGKGVRVAVSDTGTDFEHEDLSGNQIIGAHRNYAIDDPYSWRGSLPYAIGSEAHGTAVTGLIAALGWNGIGSRGVAPDANFAAFRYLGTDSDTPSSLLARTIDQADGDFDIFNYSYGYDQCFFVEEDELALLAISDGAKSLRGGLGAIYVQSAGNAYKQDLNRCLGFGSGDYAGNTNSSSELAIPEKIVVAAVNANGRIASYSTPGSGIWVSAPGGEDGFLAPAMVTTDISGCSNGYSLADDSLPEFNQGNSLNTDCNYTSLMNGTSSAAPVTSGVIALMLQANPQLSWRDIKHIFVLTADEIDYSLTDNVSHPLGAAYELSGYTYDKKWIRNKSLYEIDYSNWYGFGRINALSAVLTASSYWFPMGVYAETINPSSGEWYYSSGTVSVPIPDNSASGTSISTATTLNVAHNYFVESVQVELNITHASPKDLAVILISPMGTESKLLNINSNIYATSFPANKLLLSNAFYGEDSLGDWKIKIIDGHAPNVGTLTNWKIKINGHKVVGVGAAPLPVSSIVLPSPYPSAGTNASTPIFSFTPSPSTNVIRYEVSIGSQPGLNDTVDWTSVKLKTSALQLKKLSLHSGTRNYLNIRAVDTTENVSPVVTKFWNITPQ